MAPAHSKSLANMTQDENGQAKRWLRNWSCGGLGLFLATLHSSRQGCRGQSTARGLVVWAEIFKGNNRCADLLCNCPPQKVF